MKIVFDENKRQQNLIKHGLDFADLDISFFLSAVVSPARSGRFIAIGSWRGMMVLSVVHRPLGTEALSVISMRPASKSERKLR